MLDFSVCSPFELDSIAVEIQETIDQIEKTKQSLDDLNMPEIFAGQIKDFNSAIEKYQIKLDTIHKLKATIH